MHVGVSRTSMALHAKLYGCVWPHARCRRSMYRRAWIGRALPAEADRLLCSNALQGHACSSHVQRACISLWSLCAQDRQLLPMEAVRPEVSRATISGAGVATGMAELAGRTPQSEKQPYPISATGWPTCMPAAASPQPSPLSTGAPAAPWPAL